MARGLEQLSRKHLVGLLEVTAKRGEGSRQARPVG